MSALKNALSFDTNLYSANIDLKLSRIGRIVFDGNNLSCLSSLTSNAVLVIEGLSRFGDPQEIINAIEENWGGKVEVLSEEPSLPQIELVGEIVTDLQKVGDRSEACRVVV